MCRGLALIIESAEGRGDNAASPAVAMNESTMENAPAEGPRRVVESGDTEFVLLGTAHVSRASADEVRAEIETGGYDAVAVELCASREANLRNPDAMADMDLVQVIRQGKAGMVAANLALGAYQQRLAEQFGIEPGAEMRVALTESDARGLPVSAIDREIGTTLRRAYRSLPWWRRLTLLSGLFAGLISSDKIDEEEIERLKQGDILEETFAEFANESADLHRVLIAERDRYMAASLEALRVREAPTRVLAVVGAGHLDGLARQLGGWDDTEPAAAQAELEQVPPGSRWVRWLPWIVLLVILGGFAAGFVQDVDLGQQMVWTWIWIHGVLCAIGAILALAHPLTVLAAFVVSPLTALNPTVGAGMVVAAVEVYLRRPRVSDFSHLREDVAHVGGWWRNRVARTLLVFLFCAAGSAIGTYIAGFRIFNHLIG